MFASANIPPLAYQFPRPPDTRPPDTQGTAGSNQESVFIAVIQKSNGKVLDFRVVEK